MKIDSSSRELPGAELIRQGLVDFQSGRRTIPACLVAISRSRLSLAGLLPESAGVLFAEPERQLYAMLLEEGGDAYSRYNSLLRELISFEQALDHLPPITNNQ
jgi:hypothetical protein